LPLEVKGKGNDLQRQRRNGKWMTWCLETRRRKSIKRRSRLVLVAPTCNPSLEKKNHKKKADRVAQDEGLEFKLEYCLKKN
jgi:hypothetical protein